MSKFCPILMAGFFANSNPEQNFTRGAGNCGKDECAWWDVDADCCAILTLAKEAPK